MAFNNVNSTLQYIAKKGNYQDIANAMALICAYSSIYTTGKVPTIKRLRDGIEASSVAGLESMLTGATSQTNSIQEYNSTRDAFFLYVATTNPGFYEAVDVRLYPRICVVETPIFPVNVEDCQGTLIGAAADLATYLTLWNDQKVDVDRAICGLGTDYIFDTGVAGYLGESKIQPDNTKIHFNAPAVNNFRQAGEMKANRDSLVDREAEVKPQSIAKYSSRTI
jgi:hypothetical protein